VVTQELINYIRQKQENGISKIQIEQALTSKGWSKDDIKKGFYAYKLLISPEPKSFVSKKKSSGFGKIFFLFLLILTLAFTGYYLYTETVYLDSIKSFTDQYTKNLALNKQPSSSQTLVYPTPTISAQTKQVLFANNLSTCTPSKLQFTHIQTGEIFEKEILGLIDDKCQYTEQMPNNELIECQFSDTDRLIIAQYFKDLTMADSYATEVSVDSTDIESEDQTQVELEYTINDKQVTNPLQEAIDSGICTVSEY